MPPCPSPRTLETLGNYFGHDSDWGMSLAFSRQGPGMLNAPQCAGTQYSGDMSHLNCSGDPIEKHWTVALFREAQGRETPPSQKLVVCVHSLTHLFVPFTNVY